MYHKKERRMWLPRNNTITGSLPSTSNHHLDARRIHRRRFHRRATATGNVNGFRDDHQYQSFNNPTCHRKLKQESHVCSIQDDLIDEMAKIYIQDQKVCPSCDLYGFVDTCHALSPEEEEHAESLIRETKQSEEGILAEYYAEEQKEEQLYLAAAAAAREFIKSLPPRYVLSIDSPGEALIHMRHHASAKRDPLKAFIHITGCDFCESLSFGTSGPNNLKTIFVCCAHTIGLLEFLMGILVCGGNEIFDTNFLLSSEKIMLIRCVVNEKGVTRLDDLQKQLSIYIQAAQGIPCDSEMAEKLPVPTQIGTFDPTKVQHHPYPQTIMGADDEPSFVDDISPQVPLAELIGMECQKSEESDRTKKTRGLTRNGINVSSSIQLQVSEELDNVGLLGLRNEYDFFYNIIVDGSMRYSSDVVIYRGRLVNIVNQNTYALKAYSLSEINDSQTQDLIREVKVATKLSHKNVCQFIDVIQTET